MLTETPNCEVVFSDGESEREQRRDDCSQSAPEGAQETFVAVGNK